MKTERNHRAASRRFHAQTVRTLERLDRRGLESQPVLQSANEASLVRCHICRDKHDGFSCPTRKRKRGKSA